MISFTLVHCALYIPGYFIVIRVFLIDDHPIVYEGMLRLVEPVTDIAMCGVSNARLVDASLVLAAEPDVIVMELPLYRGFGLHFITEWKAHLSGIPVLIYSMYDESVYAERALRAGASGFLMKNEPVEQIIEVIRRVATGQVHVSEEISRRMIGRLSSVDVTSPDEALSDRELQVFRYTGEGLNNHEIAERLNLSVKTIESHIERIKAKLNIDNGRQLLRRAMEWVLTSRSPEG